MKIFVGSIIAVALMTAAALPARAQDSVGSFYAGKTIRIITPYPPGGSYDHYIRIAAEHMGKYIPGNPKIIAQNKSNLASTLKDFSENLPDDGTYMGMFAETIGISQLTDPGTSPWDVRKLAYVGSFASVNSVLFLRKDAPAKSIADFKTVDVNVGCASANAASTSKYVMLRNFLDYKFKLICGYDGNGTISVALLRGEIDVIMSAWSGWRDRAEVVDGTFRPMIQAGLKRHKDLPDVPLMQELVTDPEQKRVAEFWSEGSAIGRALVVRNTVPQDRMDALRAAFDKAVADPELLAEAAKTNLEIDPTPGVEVDRISEGLLATPKDVVQRAMKSIE